MKKKHNPKSFALVDVMRIGTELMETLSEVERGRKIIKKKAGTDVSDAFNALLIQVAKALEASTDLGEAMLAAIETHISEHGET